MSILLPSFGLDALCLAHLLQLVCSISLLKALYDPDFAAVLATWDICSQNRGLSQYTGSHLPSCLYEKMHVSGNSRTGKLMLNEKYLHPRINQAER